MIRRLPTQKPQKRSEKIPSQINQNALLPLAEYIIADSGGVNQLLTALPLQPQIVGPERGSQRSMAAEASLLRQSQNL